MKQISSFKLIKKMLSLVKGKGYLIALAVLVGTLGYLSAISITFFAGIGILSILGVSPFNMELWLIILLLCVSGLLRGIFRYCEQYLNHYMAFTLLAMVRNNVFDSLRKEGNKVLDDRSRGELLSILQSDTESLEVFYAHTITPFLIAICVETVILVLFGVLLSFYFSIFALICYIIIGVITPIIFFHANKKDGVKYREAISRNESSYLNSCYGMKEILFSSNENEEREILISNTKEINSLNKKLNKKSSIASASVNLIIMIFNIGIILLSAFLAKYEIIDIRKVILSYALLSSSFGPVIALSALPANLTMSFASARRIFKIVNEAKLEERGKDSFNFKSLELKDVSFSYSKNEPLLKNINFSIHKGEIVGLEGKSGEGKSTILKLLLSFEKPDKGEVLYNGKDVSSYSTDSLRDNVTLFSQSTYLFKNTIRYNMLLAKQDATEKEIVSALKKARIYDKIMSLEKGLDTEINDKMSNFSTGEKQRIGLARVFLKDAPLLLLDEATSNIDAENEAFILNELKKETGKAILIISHRKTSLSICSRCYSLKKGELS